MAAGEKELGNKRARKAELCFLTALQAASPDSWCLQEHILSRSCCDMVSLGLQPCHPLILPDLLGASPLSVPVSYSLSLQTQVYMESKALKACPPKGCTLRPRGCEFSTQYRGAGSSHGPEDAPGSPPKSALHSDFCFQHFSWKAPRLCNTLPRLRELAALAGDGLQFQESNSLLASSDTASTRRHPLCRHTHMCNLQ